MPLTITEVAAGAGKGGKRPFQFGGPGVAVARLFTVAFPNPYTVGGESLASIFSQFKEVLAVFVSQDEPTIAARREFVVDHTNQKLILLTAFNTESGAVDQTAVDKVKLLVIGY
jgi:hypothetical protein